MGGKERRSRGSRRGRTAAPVSSRLPEAGSARLPPGPERWGHGLPASWAWASGMGLGRKAPRAWAAPSLQGTAKVPGGGVGRGGQLRPAAPTQVRRRGTRTEGDAAWGRRAATAQRWQPDPGTGGQVAGAPARPPSPARGSASSAHCWRSSPPSPPCCPSQPSRRRSRPVPGVGLERGGCARRAPSPQPRPRPAPTPLHAAHWTARRTAGRSVRRAGERRADSGGGARVGAGPPAGSAPPACPLRTRLCLLKSHSRRRNRAAREEERHARACGAGDSPDAPATPPRGGD